MTILLRIADRVINRPLLIAPDKANIVLGVLNGRLPIASGMIDSRVDPQQLPQAALDALRVMTPSASRFVGTSVEEDASGRRVGLPYRRTESGVGIVTITGALINRGAWVGNYCGETSYEGIKHQLDAVGRDPRVHSVILDVESPGGEAVGTFEVAAAVRALAESKPVTAVVNGMAASAAYAIASAATRIVTTPTGLAGSVGVVLLHVDYSRALDREGITPTLIHAGANKVDGNPFQPLSDDVKESLQAEVNKFYGLFVDTVVAGRKGMSAAAVRATNAKIFIGEEAVSEGLADAVGSFESVLADLTSARSAARNSSAVKPGGRMSTDNPGPQAAEQISLAQHNAALAVARQESFAAGRAEGVAAGAAESDARWGAIMGSEEAKGREAHAVVFAEAGIAPDKAKAQLAKLPKTSSLSQRMEADKSEGLGGDERTGANGGEPNMTARERGKLIALRALGKEKG